MWWLLLSCQDPFEVDRHDLVGLRVAALTVERVSADQVQPVVAVVADGRPWSRESVRLEWHWVRDSRELWAIDSQTSPAAAGAEPLLDVPKGGLKLGLLASHGGEEHRSIVEIPSAAGVTPESLTLQTVPWTVDAVTGPELLLEPRREATAVAAAFVPEGGFGRLSLGLAGDTADTVVRWMGTGGTFFELDATTTDWAAGDLLLDDDELVEPRVALEAGPVTVIGLTITEGAPSRFLAREVHVGEPGPGLWVNGRWLPTDTAVTVGADEAVRGTLAVDPTAPSGLVLTGPTVLAQAGVKDWGSASTVCGESAPFDPGWLLRQRCATDPLDGTEAIVVPEATP